MLLEKITKNIQEVKYFWGMTVILLENGTVMVSGDCMNILTLYKYEKIREKICGNGNPSRFQILSHIKNADRMYDGDNNLSVVTKDKKEFHIGYPSFL